MAAMKSPVLALTDAVVTVAAFSTAVQLGLLDRIDREPADAPELARTCGADERGVRLLLGALESGGFVERLPDGRYRPALTGLAGYHPVIPLWDHLPEAVRTGLPAGDGQDLSFGFWGDTVKAVAAALPAAARVLDAGTDASWSIAYATRNPGARMSLTEHAGRAVSRAGLADRFDFLADESHPDDHYDLIMVPHMCALLGEPACAELLGKLAPALAPGGVLAVIETLAGGRGSAIRELCLYLRTGRGAVHPPECYRRWLTEAGLTTVDSVEVDGPVAVTVITGRS
jgi:Methyltransferase domain